MNPRAPLCLLLLCAPALAQFNDPWVAFEEAPAMLAAGVISDVNHETDLAWADLDLNGFVDVVVARKQPFTTTGKRPNVLLMNVDGVLTDLTAALASASDFPGDAGFLTPTNDRDVVIADLDADGFAEVITAADLGSGEPKHISHPRVYQNLRGGAGASWLGLRYEDARIPQLFHLVSGLPVDPRFVAVAAGDVDNDGFVDLYFGDNDTGATLFGPLEPPSEDCNDRLLINDGTGFFSDQTALALTPEMVDSNFCNSVTMGDFNQDGTLDVLKQTTYAPSNSAWIAYNDPSSPGSFVAFDPIWTQTPYFVAKGDLNNDGRLDVVIEQNNNDKVLFNLSTAPSGLVNWSADVDLAYLVGGDQGYASNTLVADLDGDGWRDVLIADVDPEIPLYMNGFRTHVYHNRGGTVGGTDIVLIEERASTSDSDWIGVVGMTASDLEFAHDVAVFDIDVDGRVDILISRRDGTQVWRQVPQPVCQADIGYGDGQPVLEICGGDLASGNDATLRIFNATPNAPVFVSVAASANPTFVPQLGGTFAALPSLLLLQLQTDGSGELSMTVPGGGGPVSYVTQAVVVDGPGALSATNALQVDFLP